MHIEPPFCVSLKLKAMCRVGKCGNVSCERACGKVSGKTHLVSHKDSYISQAQEFSKVKGSQFMVAPFWFHAGNVW